jgi:hypothetical protein
VKKIIALLSVAIFAAAFFAFAAEDTKPELRPAQKVMQARVAWLAASCPHSCTVYFANISFRSFYL